MGLLLSGGCLVQNLSFGSCLLLTQLNSHRLTIQNPKNVAIPIPGSWNHIIESVQMSIAKEAGVNRELGSKCQVVTAWLLDGQLPGVGS